MEDLMSCGPIAVVQEVYEAFGRRDIAKVFGLLSGEVEMIQSYELPWGGVYRGHDGARQFFGKLGAAIDSTLDIERLICAGNHVAAVGWTHGRVKANGANYRIPISHVWRVRDGMVTEVRFFIDHPGMLAALGLRDSA
jgi:ketosteroid isomerase-like protein